MSSLATRGSIQVTDPLPVPYADALLPEVITLDYTWDAIKLKSSMTDLVPNNPNMPEKSINVLKITFLQYIGYTWDAIRQKTSMTELVPNNPNMLESQYLN